jgi:hypothetical protein
MKIVQNRRLISWRPIKRLDQQVDITGGTNSSSSGATDHSHNNKQLLDSLSMDNDGRLKSNGQIVNVPLIQEEW